MECRSMSDYAFECHKMSGESSLFVRKYNSIKFILERFNGEIMLSDIAKERIDTAVRNILSGNNECGTLNSAADTGNGTYFYNAIAPIVSVYEMELQDITNKRNELLKDCEAKRFALEMVASNLDSELLRDTCVESVNHGLPGRLNMFDKIPNKCKTC